MDEERVFYESSERKKAFLEQKNHQNFYFFKGVSPWFLSKNRDFLLFSFYVKWMKKKCFFEGFERKEAFLEQKNVGSKNHQNLHFFQRG